MKPRAFIFLYLFPVTSFFHGRNPWSCLFTLLYFFFALATEGSLKISTETDAFGHGGVPGVHSSKFEVWFFGSEPKVGGVLKYFFMLLDMTLKIAKAFFDPGLFFFLRSLLGIFKFRVLNPVDVKFFCKCQQNNIIWWKFWKERRRMRLLLGKGSTRRFSFVLYGERKLTGDPSFEEYNCGGREKLENEEDSFVLGWLLLTNEAA